MTSNDRETASRTRFFTRLRAGTLAVALTVAGAAAVLVGGAPAGATSFQVLTTGQHLTPGQVLAGPMIVGGNKALDHRYELTLTSGGDLQIQDDYLYQDSKSTIWSTHTSKGTYAAIGSDGNFTIAGTTWQSGTAKAGMPTGAVVTQAVLDTAGALTLETSGGTAEWRSSNGLCGKTTLTNGRASTAISAACREVGITWYSYGAGHGTTPGRSYGHYDGSDPASLNDNTKLGFDCSGLTRWAYYLAMKADVPRNAAFSSQGTNTVGEWQGGMSGTHVSSSSALKAGDFVWFGYGPTNPGTLHHTALYIGGGYIVEAPNSGMHLQVALLSSHSDYYGGIHVTAFS